jgi:hypothetical protein
MIKLNKKSKKAIKADALFFAKPRTDSIIYEDVKVDTNLINIVHHEMDRTFHTEAVTRIDFIDYYESGAINAVNTHHLAVTLDAARILHKKLSRYLKEQNQIIEDDIIVTKYNKQKEGK